MPPVSSIAAIATPQAPSALGIVRCSGSLSSKIFPDLKPRVATLKKYFSKDGTFLDEVVATFYAGPASFTGEDSLEITCHGNPFILQKILTDLLARGFTVAEPGEFSRRAFINGRIDLTQAEAIASVIAAHSDRALACAHRQLAGELGTSIKTFADELLSLIASVEATIDFPEEDVPSHLPAPENFENLIHRLTSLRSTSRAHQLTFEGVRVALVGAPNAGKSSLFNALLGRDRALVSPVAGTTRDYIEAPLTLGGHLITLVDTAGLHDKAKDIEAMGITKTRDQLATADIILLVLDGTTTDLSALANISGTHPHSLIAVANKSDLPTFRSPSIPPPHISGYILPPNIIPFPVSATTGKGLNELRAHLISQLNSLMPAADSLMVSARHAAALDECLAQISSATELLRKKSEAPLIAHHLHSALNYLGEILGRFDNEQILDKLFSNFCIGK